MALLIPSPLVSPNLLLDHSHLIIHKYVKTTTV